MRLATHRSAALAALALLLTLGVQAQPTISPLWTLDSETAGFGAAVSNTTRGAAYNPATGNLLVASRQGGTFVYPVNGTTGVVGASLNTTGITGGTFNLNVIGVSDDGQIFACNLATAATTAAPFKIYRWANESDTPTVVYADGPDAVTARRYGDSFAVWGSGTDVRIYASGSSNTTLAEFIWDGTTMSAPTLIPVASGAARGGMARGADGSTIWINGRGTNTQEIARADGTLIRSIPTGTSTISHMVVGTFSAGGRNYVVAGVLSPELQADIVDVTGTPFLAATLSRFGTNTNTNATGAISVDAANQRVYLYGTNIGASAYSVASLPPSLAIAGPAAWHMLAAPSTGLTHDDLLGSIWTQGFPGADAAFGTPNVYAYDESATGDLQAGYVAPANQSDALPHGEGRFVYVYEDDDFMTPEVDGGFPKALSAVSTPVAPSATFSFAISYTDDPGQPASEDGWNLLGNPFPQALDWDAVTIGGSLDAAVYAYDPAYLGGSYRTYSGGVGSLTDGILAMGQGFWAHATGGDATLAAPPASRANGGTLLRSAAPAGVIRMELRESGAAGAETFVALSQEAALAVDALDAYLLDPLRTDFLRLGTEAPAGTASEAARLAIQALPTEIDGEVRLPLAAEVVGGPDGARSLALAWDAATLPAGWSAALVDTQTGQRVSLTEAGTLAFETQALAPRDEVEVPTRLISRGGNAAQAAPGRFEIVLSRSVVASEGEAPAAATLVVGPNPTRGGATVTLSLAEAAEATVAVYDALGRRVALAFEGLAPAGTSRIALPAGLAPGVYVVRADAAGTAQSVRFVVTR
jgi:hypothetical protein